MRNDNSTIVLFRNDDVNELTDELKAVTDVLYSRGIPLTHTVEPGNVTDEAVDWLKGLKQENPGLIEIVQHGWQHTQHGSGEFGDERSYDEQFSDLSRGKKRLQELFGDDFFNMLTIPFGVFNGDTIKAAVQLDFEVFCVHFNRRLSRRIFYKVGNFLNRGDILGKKVSNHLRNYPGTNMFEIDSAISFIKKYYGHDTNDCLFREHDDIMEEFAIYRRMINVVVLLLHHRFHYKPEHIELIERVADSLKNDPTVEFATYQDVYKKYRG